MKTEQREWARRLRSEGKSVKEIAKEVGVSPGSVSLWVKNIALTEDQKRHLASKIGGWRFGVSARLTSRNKSKRVEWQNAGRGLAKRFAGEKTFVAGCVLYWAEGEKGRHTVSVTNSDPDILRMFVAFVGRYFGVKCERLSVFCRYYTDLAGEGEPERWWLSQLGLPVSCLRRSCVNYYPKDRLMVKRRYSHGKLKNGVCRVKFDDVEIKQMLYGAIQETLELSKPEWIE
jgi:transcriptional regulator with XRE-family HTH domain